MSLQKTPSTSSCSSGAFTSLFVDQVQTEQESLVFVKKLVSVVVSSIFYMRGFFTEEAYEEKVIEGMKVKVILEDANGLGDFLRGFDGVYDALQERNLDELSLTFYDEVNQPEYARESYKLKFAYAADGTFSLSQLSAKTPQKSDHLPFRKSTKKFLRNLLIMTQSFGKLPGSTIAGMCITLREETPMDYETDGFVPAEAPIFPEGTVTVKVGQVMTDFHRVRLKVRSNDEALKTTHSRFPFKVNRRQRPMKVMHENPMPLSPEPCLKRRASQSDFLTSIRCLSHHDKCIPKSPLTTPVEFTPPVIVRCPCGLEDMDVRMLKCSICEYLQHAVCFKITNPEDNPKNHVCNHCSRAGLGICTDPFLTSFLVDEVKEACLYRRTLWHLLQQDPKRCYRAYNIADDLNVSYPTAKRLFALLKIDCVFHLLPADGKIVDQKYLRRAIALKFSRKQDIHDKKRPLRPSIKELLKTPVDKTAFPPSCQAKILTPNLECPKLVTEGADDQETKIEERMTKYRRWRYSTKSQLV